MSWSKSTNLCKYCWRCVLLLIYQLPFVLCCWIIFFCQFEKWKVLLFKSHKRNNDNIIWNALKLLQSSVTYVNLAFNLIFSSCRCPHLSNLGHVSNLHLWNDRWVAIVGLLCFVKKGKWSYEITMLSLCTPFNFWSNRAVVLKHHMNIMPLEARDDMIGTNRKKCKCPCRWNAVFQPCGNIK
jgi:hypothetical protein